MPSYTNKEIKANINAMKNNQLLSRITMNPQIMVGKPVIKGTRLTVEYIVGLFANGSTSAEILDEYKGLTKEDNGAHVHYL